MPTKTIYVRDQQLWDRCKTEAAAEGLSMSALIEREVRVWVEKQEKEQKMSESLPKDEFTRIYLETRDKVKGMTPETAIDQMNLLGWIIKVQKLMAAYNEGAFTAQEVFDNVIASAVECDFAQTDAITGEVLKRWDADSETYK